MRFIAYRYMKLFLKFDFNTVYWWERRIVFIQTPNNKKSSISGVKL
jgi:hypothetical protein